MHWQLPLNLNFLYSCTACYHLNSLTNITSSCNSNKSSRCCLVWGERGFQVWMPEVQWDLMHFLWSCSSQESWSWFWVGVTVGVPESWYSPLSPPYLLVAFTKARKPCLKGAGDCFSLILPTIWWPLVEGSFSSIRGLFLSLGWHVWKSNFS